LQIYFRLLGFRLPSSPPLFVVFRVHASSKFSHKKRSSSFYCEPTYLMQLLREEEWNEKQNKMIYLERTRQISSQLSRTAFALSNHLVNFSSRPFFILRGVLHDYHCEVLSELQREFPNDPSVLQTLGFLCTQMKVIHSN
jgi:hypothetical protein